MREMSGRRAVSLVMYVRTRPTDTPVLRGQFDAPKKALVGAAPVSLVSFAERVVTTAVSVPPISIDGVVAPEDECQLL